MQDDIHPAQLRAARALVGWTREELADKAGTTERTVARIEDGQSSPRATTAAAIRAALQTAGVIFIDENDEGPGVRLKKKSFDYCDWFPKSSVIYIPCRSTQVVDMLCDPSFKKRDFPDAFVITMKENPHKAWDELLKSLPTLINPDRCDSMQNTNDERPRGIRIIRPNKKASPGATNYLRDIFSLQEVKIARIFLSPLGHGVSATRAKEKKGKHYIGALAYAEKDIFLIDRSSLVYPAKEKSKMDRIKSLIHVAASSGHLIEVATEPLSVDTASLSPEEAFKVIGSVEYEQLRDFSQIERLVSQLEKR